MVESLVRALFCPLRYPLNAISCTQTPETFRDLLVDTPDSRHIVDAVYAVHDIAPVKASSMLRNSSDITAKSWSNCSGAVSPVARSVTESA